MASQLAWLLRNQAYCVPNTNFLASSAYLPAQQFAVTVNAIIIWSSQWRFQEEDANPTLWNSTAFSSLLGGPSSDENFSPGKETKNSTKLPRIEQRTAVLRMAPASLAGCCFIFGQWLTGLCWNSNNLRAVGPNAGLPQNENPEGQNKAIRSFLRNLNIYSRKGRFDELIVGWPEIIVIPTPIKGRKEWAHLFANKDVIRKGSFWWQSKNILTENSR